MDHMARRGIPLQNSINVTPLIDVCLVLLIVFMSMTPLLDSGYDVAVPPSAKPGAPASSPAIVVSLTRRGVILVDGEAISPPEMLRERLRAIVRARLGSMVFFSCDESIGYDQAMKVMDAIKGAGETGRPLPIGIVVNPLPIRQDG